MASPDQPPPAQPQVSPRASSSDILSPVVNANPTNINTAIQREEVSVHHSI